MTIPEKQNIVRQRWLVAFFIYAIWLALYYGLTMALGYYRDVINNRSQNNEAIIGSLAIFILITGMLLMHYYFGYIKRGPRLLAWISIIGGIKFIAKIPEIVSELKNLFLEFGLTSLIIDYCYILEIAGLFVCSYYLFNCWKLYSLNSDIKLSDNSRPSISDHSSGAESCGD